MDMQKLQISARKIIVGIDFGTEYTSVAWALTNDAERISTITIWPLSETVLDGEYSDRVPTKLRYSGGEVQWGFTIPVTAPSDEIIEGFKLYLDSSAQPPNQEVSSAAAKSGRTVESLVTDYISAISEHLIYTLHQKIGETYVKNTPFELFLTVPAIWPECAKERFKMACQNAKYLATYSHSVYLISDSEAAISYTLHRLDPHGLVLDDTVVLVDAGSRAVDLTSYRIKKLSPILELEETAPGSGALCGLKYLSLRFARFLKAELSSRPGFDDEVLAEAVEHFEKTAPQLTISAGSDEVYNIPVLGLGNDRPAGITRGRYQMKKANLKAIFEPIVLDVIKLIKNQVTASNEWSNTPVTAVILTGSFGDYAYLKEQIYNSLGRNIRILQPPHTYQAVVYGAVRQGLGLALQ